MAFRCSGPLTLVFFQAPFKEKLLQADTAYLKVDYTGVIDELEGVAPSSLPTTQKYELATSYLQGLNFSEDQKKVILNNVTNKPTCKKNLPTFFIIAASGDLIIAILSSFSCTFRHILNLLLLHI